MKMKLSRQVICLVVFLFIVSMSVTKIIDNQPEKENNSGIPDVFSSVSTNYIDYLTVVANCSKIEDKEAFANQVVDMYLENSFHSMIFSTENGYPTELFINVYLHKDDVKTGNALFKVQLKPDEMNTAYNVKDNQEHYTLLVDDEQVRLL